MKLVLIVSGVLILTCIGVHTVLHNGSLLHYLDTHPDSSKVPPVEFFIGEGYYIFGDLQNSATYYQRIAERYPQSSYADDAYFNYLQSLDDSGTPRGEMAEAYATYMEKFPQGSHAEIVQKRIEFCRNSR